MLQWFQVACPSCAYPLQVKLPEGITSVQCFECSGVFALQIQPTSLLPQAGLANRGRKRKGDREGDATPRALSAYNTFMKAQVAKVKTQHPELKHQDAFKMVSAQIA